MKILRLLTFLTLTTAFLSFSTTLFGSEINPGCKQEDKPSVACSITDFIITPQICGDVYYYSTFTFTGVDFGLNGFTVSSNNSSQVYNFNLGDNYWLYLPTQCDEDVIVTITDNDNPACTASVNLGLLCCDCYIGAGIIQSECNGSSFSVEIEHGVLGSCYYYDPVFRVNGEIYTPIQINGFYYIYDLTSSMPFIDYEICYIVPNFSISCFNQTLANPCYAQIGFSSLNIDSTNCYNSMIDIPYTLNQGSGMSGYIISDNFGNSQYYDPGDPQIYTIQADCFIPITLTITDAIYPVNTSTTTLGPICCPCEFELNLQISPCTNGLTDISFDFNTISGSCSYYDWILSVNNDTLDLDYLDGNYFTNGYQSNDSLLYVNICSLAPSYPACFRDTIANPCYVPTSSSQCMVTNFSVTPDTASCTGEIISLNFSVTGADFGSNGYKVTTNTGFSQIYHPTDTTLLILFADCNENIIVTITDAIDSLCMAMDTLGLLCCPCSADVIITQGNCMNGGLDASIMINNQQGSCINNDWTLLINGQNYSLNPTNTGYNVSVSNSNDSLLIYSLCNILADTFCIFETIVNPCYVPNTSHQCTITNLSVSPDVTSCTGEVISLNFSVAGTDFGMNGYTITTNTGFSQLYNPSDTTLMVLIADCNENITITITDAMDSLCTAKDTVGLLCCPCDVDFSLVSGTCIDGLSTANFTINSIQGSCINADWSLNINGQNFTLIPTNTGFTVTGINSLDSLLLYQLCYELSGNQDCIITTMENPCFESTVSTKNTQIQDILDISMITGQRIELTNKTNLPMNIYLYAVDGTIINFDEPLQPQSNKIIEINHWPTGTYILKAISKRFTLTKKLINVR